MTEGAGGDVNSDEKEEEEEEEEENHLNGRERREKEEAEALLPAEQSLRFIDERGGEKVALRFDRDFESRDERVRARERRFFIAKAHARIHIQQWREEQTSRGADEQRRWS